MKRNVGQINYNRLGNHMIGSRPEAEIDQRQVQPDHFRWFCGLYDLDYTYVCQTL